MYGQGQQLLRDGEANRLHEQNAAKADLYDQREFAIDADPVWIIYFMLFMCVWLW
jgi:hypothetical protein